MGLLDEAIREHLDLKRRRGADPGEIAREEAEALGPVRRDVGADGDAPGPEPDHVAGLEDPGEAYAEDVHEDLRDQPHLAESPRTHEEPYAEAEAESATPPHGDPYQRTREFSAEELSAALGDPEPEREPEPESPRGSEHEHAGAVSMSAWPEAAESAPAGDGEAEDDEDVLEETPEFLQETPEHDRLWFEQKPPKDFDF